MEIRTIIWFRSYPEYLKEAEESFGPKAIFVHKTSANSELFFCESLLLFETFSKPPIIDGDEDDRKLKAHRHRNDHRSYAMDYDDHHRNIICN